MVFHAFIIDSYNLFFNLCKKVLACNSSPVFIYKYILSAQRASRFIQTVREFDMPFTLTAIHHHHHTPG
ncbi:hypothetical protein PRUB_b1396 [Pseudoalteromonas rubra]|uniref:Uncharacterized protein n=1 Tax=Pseudoalteromonas rubra TaxID=43658 RepID=A0A8T0C460_9GAMM|nr:hypothetical protein PRUB_b1396 [Pseudoalteromonas rubra]